MALIKSDEVEKRYWNFLLWRVWSEAQESAKRHPCLFIHLVLGQMCIVTASRLGDVLYLTLRKPKSFSHLGVFPCKRLAMPSSARKAAVLVYLWSVRFLAHNKFKSSCSHPQPTCALGKWDSGLAIWTREQVPWRSRTLNWVVLGRGPWELFSCLNLRLCRGPI